MLSDKVFKTYTEQRKILESRGLVINHPRIFTNAIQRDDYYNIINGYKKYFLAGYSPEHYVNNTTFEQVYALYSFDMSIRNLFLANLLGVEKNIKSLIAYHFSEVHGHDHKLYLNINSFKHASQENIYRANDLIGRINADIVYYSHKGHTAICHYLKNHGYLPLWVLHSVMSFGRIAHFYSCMELAEQQAVAAHFDMSAGALDGFMYFLDDFRNTCAHGARIYTANKFRRFQKLIPDTNIHIALGIPRNNAGNYITGKCDVLAMLITLKCFLPKREFAQTKKRFKKYHKKAEVSIPQNIMQLIDNEMGITANYLSCL